MQWLTHTLGGTVEKAERREYGRAQLSVDDSKEQGGSHLFRGVPASLRVWNSHGDHVRTLPEGFRTIARTENAIAAVENKEKKIYAVEFHPEVNHTERGTELLRNRLKLHVVGVDASERFLAQLKGVTDPEEKRKRIGREFIAVFAEKAQKLQAGEAHGEIAYLVQGTLYPDVIESVSVKGPSATIKTHHNVGGLPEKI